MDVDETLEHFFIPVNLIEMWPRVNNMYKYFEFTDELDDNTRYKEYVWVIEQYRKYIGSKKADVMELKYKLDELEKKVQEMLADGTEKSSTDPIRPGLVYNAMRNEWLQQLLFNIRLLISESTEVNDGYYRFD